LIILKLIGLDINGQNYQKENDKIVSYRYLGEVSIKYDQIFRFFISRGNPIIPIAIYRFDANNNFFVVTNPKGDTMVNAFDQIVCIGTSPNEFSKFDINEYMVDDDEADNNSDDSDSNRSDNKSKKTNIKKQQNDISLSKQGYEDLTETELIKKLREELENYLKRSNVNEDINQLIPFGKIDINNNINDSDNNRFEESDNMENLVLNANKSKENKSKFNKIDKNSCKYYF
jgi:hypothetical protein